MSFIQHRSDLSDLDSQSFSDTDSDASANDRLVPERISITISPRLANRLPALPNPVAPTVNIGPFLKSPRIANYSTQSIQCKPSLSGGVVLCLFS